MKKNVQPKDETHSSEKLLKAALVVFARDGFHGATTKGIAKEAGVNEALIIRHFQNKEGLFLAVVQKNIILAKEEISYEMRESIEEELVAFTKHFAGIINKNKELYRILFAHNIQNPEFKTMIRSQLRAGKKVLIERLQVLAKKERLKEFDYAMVEGIVINIAYTSAIYSVIMGFTDFETSLKGAVERVRFFWTNMRGGLGKQKPKAKSK